MRNGWTLIYHNDNQGEHNTFIGKFDPPGKHSGGPTAHQQMWEALRPYGVKKKDCIGGTLYQEGGGEWAIAFDSRTMNGGHCHGNAFQPAIRALENAEYLTVPTDSDHNYTGGDPQRGQKYYQIAYRY